MSNREVFLALGVAGLVNMAMIAMAAVAFHDGTHDRIAEIETAYRTLTPLLGAGAALLFMLALLASGFSSSVVGVMAGQMIMQGFVSFRIPLWLRRLVVMAPSLAVVAAGMDITRALGAEPGGIEPRPADPDGADPVCRRLKGHRSPAGIDRDVDATVLLPAFGIIAAVGEGIGRNRAELAIAFDRRIGRHVTLRRKPVAHGAGAVFG